jgi:hypothetical protein
MAIGGEKKMVLGTEEAIATLIQELLITKNPKTQTDLSDEEIGFLALLSTVGERLKIEALKEFCKNFSLYRVSRYRQGRRELANIASWSGEAYERKKGIKSIKDLFGGIR